MSRGWTAKQPVTHIAKNEAETYCGITKEQVQRSFRSGSSRRPAHGISVVGRDAAGNTTRLGYPLCERCKTKAWPGTFTVAGGKKRHSGGGPKTCHCGATTGQCPECGETYEHGTVAYCSNPSCMEMNAPVDCVGCGMVVSEDLKGVIDFEGRLKPWRRGGKGTPDIREAMLTKAAGDLNKLLK
jgi:hypothetical protein